MAAFVMVTVAVMMVVVVTVASVHSVFQAAADAQVGEEIGQW
jgi:hypothetical protein